MRCTDERSGSLFSYVDLEARVRSDHPSRALLLFAAFTSIHFWDGHGKFGSFWMFVFGLAGPFGMAAIRRCKPAQIRWRPVLGAGSVQPPSAAQFLWSRRPNADRRDEQSFTHARAPR
jgi:hypothetical protein